MKNRGKINKNIGNTKKQEKKQKKKLKTYKSFALICNT
jgi:hypothetical protein